MTTPLARLTNALADRYRLERELGAGGMATVYLAHDLRHERDVAIKVLRTDAAEQVGAERFLREIRITAKLDHPQILMLIDSGDADGLLYYVMPFVDGESLRDRLRREAPMPVSEALRIAVQVADALDYAHRHGVVHRDVKPENILLSGVHVKLADFGIARASRAGQATQAMLTQVGMALGTPAYMSPEQFFGDADVDHRSDLYALACVVYEMLTGAPPFAGEAVTKRLTADAPRLGVTRTGIPPMVDLVVARALAREAHQRHSTIAEFAGALQAELSGPVAIRVSPTTAPVSPRAIFVARDRELAEGRELLASLAEGRGGVLLLGGEPGVGKTRLATALLEDARRLRALCLVGHCYEMEGMPPFTPFAEVLDYVARLVPPETFRAVLGDAASEVARVQPLLRTTFADIPAPMDLPPEMQKAHLYAQYRAFNERAVRVSPVVLLLDDLHWADGASLGLLEHIATYAHELPLVIIGTYRDTDLEVTRPFARSLEQLTRQRLAKRIAVRRLPEEGTAALLAALGGSAPPASLVRALHAETDGNPFFVEEVFQHLREEGHLLDTAGHWKSSLDVDRLDVPEGVRLVIGRRLERLSEGCRTMLAAAAVVGPRFELDLLIALGEQDEDALLDAVEEAAASHLILEQRGARQAAYSFAHELIRQTLLSQFSMPRRQRRHLKIAQALAAMLGVRAATRAADLAHHFHQAGAAASVDDTVHWLLVAAEQALERGAFDQAFAHTEQVVGLDEELPAARRAKLGMVRGHALKGLGKWDRALDAFGAALAAAAEDHDVDALGVAAMESAMVLSWGMRGREAYRELERAAALLPDTPTLARVQILATSVRVGILASNDLAPSEAILARALADAAVLRHPEADLLVGFAQAFLLQATAQFGPLEAILQDLLVRLDTPRHRWMHTEMCGIMQNVLQYRLRLAESRAMAAHLRRVAEETGHWSAKVWVGVADSFHAYTETNDRALDDYYRESVISLAHTERVPSINLGLLLPHLVWRDEWPAATALIAEHGAVDHAFYTGLYEGGGLMLQAFEAPEVLRRRFADGESWLGVSRVRRSIGAILHAALGVEAFAIAGERARAAEGLPILERSIAEGMDGMSGPILIPRLAGVAAAASGDFELAFTRFDDAERFLAGWGNPVPRAQVLLWRAWAHQLRGLAGDVDTAHNRLAEAEPVLAAARWTAYAPLIARLRSS